MRDYPQYPEERDGKAGKAPSRPQEPLEDDRYPQLPTERRDTGEGDENERRPQFPPDDGGIGGRD